MRIEMHYIIRAAEKCDMYFTDFENAKKALEMIDSDCYMMEIESVFGYFENMQIGKKDGEIYGLD